jgi:all-trans-8'-apo-beta-carotenal 15,15'-oxygenase
MDRRSFLTAAAGFGTLAFTPERLLAAAANSGDWTLAFADVEADVASRPLRRVSGRAPADLSGVLFRNGPAKFRRPGGSATHWFDGDGLIRRFAIEDGQASLAARFADTRKRRTDAAAAAVVTPGFGTPGRPGVRVAGPDDVNAANTSVLRVGGHLWALWEAGSPVALDPVTLETRGFHAFRDDLAGMPFLAHPRVEPDGRVWNLGVSGRRAIVWRLAADGSLEAAEPVALPRASYLHDFSATARHLVLVLQPWVQQPGGGPMATGYAWRPADGTQILVLDKDDLSRRRVFEVPAFSFFHMADAWEETDGTIRLSICAEESPEFGLKGAEALLLGKMIASPPPLLTNLVLRPDGRAEMLRLGPEAEFPRGDPRFAGLKRDYDVFLGGGAPEQPLFTAVSVRDGKRGRIRSFDFGRGHIVEEMVFAPRPGGSAEFDGWLVGTSINLKARATELHAFDARRIEDGPIVSWRADVALPATFHGVWSGRA